ncbi:hypothetical protein ACFOZ7_11840 [Natribaculum luteum]|uniref:Uncharacterized protein n=1 Tax=Natribaculum luteum TaxID=1586232 RepID=A0ABD5P001_9EURY|nr:hypothetical protein [Natribaculum luteum]
MFGDLSVILAPTRVGSGLLDLATIRIEVCGGIVVSELVDVSFEQVEVAGVRNRLEGVFDPVFSQVDFDYMLNRRNTTAFRPWIRAVTQ